MGATKSTAIAERQTRPATAFRPLRDTSGVGLEEDVRHVTRSSGEAPFPKGGRTDSEEPAPLANRGQAHSPSAAPQAGRQNVPSYPPAEDARNSRASTDVESLFYCIDSQILGLPLPSVRDGQPPSSFPPQSRRSSRNMRRVSRLKRSHWILVIALVAISGVAGVVVSKLRPKRLAAVRPATSSVTSTPIK